MIPGIEFSLAVTFAYLSGMVVNFGFSKWLVFESANTGKTKREAVKFFIVASIGLLVTVFVSWASLLYLETMGLPDLLLQNLIGIQDRLDTIAHLMGMAVGLIANFLGHEIVSFKETGIWKKIQKNLDQNIQK